MSLIEEWARAWGVSAAALADLRARTGQAVLAHTPDESQGPGETAVSSRVRWAAARKGLHLWRNNVGAGYDDAGNFMRWGLANDSKQLNAVVKSADLIGIRPVIVTPDMVGKLFGQFVSYEAKREGWKYTGTPREVAQAAWRDLILANGGEARFVTSERDV